MTTENDTQRQTLFADKIGYQIGKQTVKNVDVQYQKTFDFLPELAVFIAGYTVKKTFSRRTVPPKNIKNNIRIFFHNVFENDELVNDKRKIKTQTQPPYVRVFSSALPYTSIFKKDSRVKVVSVIISADYLKQFLKQDANKFPFLFDGSNNFLIEEMVTDDILRTINDMVKKEEPTELKDYYYQLKVMELLFYLFESLSRRKNEVHQKLNEIDIESIYKVRERIVSSLNKAVPIADLKKIAGMNELKMRGIFKQIFGMGIYDYFQYLRMQEAARLLRDEKLSVSEAGYEMGFENLSHFSKVFEKHIGLKPKKYSSGW